ncbi:Hypothetical protein c4086 [Escherichia coli CFT073]|uniref:Uncharacterized protein n=1 Tax=Escherichia coli O6:H1 (strain CFT073 / ATCC 700928 / UPEC) TaxID=199310 RepID=A0A0H2VE07_ECOL6|nr:Hypothetical protein c4086 [Escherichia coli CFT073]
MYYSSDLLSAANEVQILAFFQGDVSFFPVATTTDTLSVTFNFPFNYQGVNDFDFDFKQFLHSSFDFCFGRVFSNFEYDGVGFFHRSRRFFRNVRCTQHLQQTFFTNHASISSTCLTASAVITTLSKAIRLTGSIPVASRTSTLCRLRAARNRFSSSSPVMISTSSRAMSFSFCASSLVFGASTENFSTTIRRS